MSTDSSPENCVFCKIVRGEESAIIVCESDNCLAFFPTKPAVMGHTLVIPRQHVPDLWHATEILEAELMSMVVTVGRALDSVLRPHGMNLISSAGAEASQTVFHLHLHVVPRWRGDVMGRIWPRSRPANEALKRDVAALIRVQCAMIV